MPKQKLGTFIKAKRLTLNISQRMLSKKTGISSATISRLEAGIIRDVRAANLFRLFSALKVTWADWEQRP